MYKLITIFNSVPFFFHIITKYKTIIFLDTFFSFLIFLLTKNKSLASNQYKFKKKIPK